MVCDVLFFLNFIFFELNIVLVVLGGELAVPFSRNPLHAGLNSLKRVSFWKRERHHDRPPRNRSPRTSSGPEGSSDKWRYLCRGKIPIIWMTSVFRRISMEGAQPTLSQSTTGVDTPGISLFSIGIKTPYHLDILSDSLIFYQNWAVNTVI